MKAPSSRPESAGWGALGSGDPGWADVYERLKLDRGDPKAWAVLENRVRAWAGPGLRQLGWHVVEDAVADSCSMVAVGFEKAHGPETFKGFVFGHYLNVRRRLLQEHRQLGVPPEAVDLPVSPDDEPSPDERDLLHRCLSQLPSREQQAMRLRYFEDAAAVDIAAELGVTEGNARRIVFNGLAHLRRCVQHAWPLGRGS